MDKKNIIFIIILVITISFASTYTANYLYSANQVSYSNTHTGMTSDNVQGALEELYSHATDYTEIRKMIYPVGSIYLSVEDDTVAKVQNRFGGTWEVFGEGRTIVGVGTGTDSNSTNKTFTINETGGEYTHTLTGDESGRQSFTTASTGYIKNGITGGSHSHLERASDGGASVNNAVSGGSGSAVGGRLTATYITNGKSTIYTAAATHTHDLPNHTHTVGAADAKSAHNNVQPYITVYMYKRVS